MARSVRELMQALLDEAALSVDETALLLSLSRHGAYEGVKAGEIPSIRIGRCIRVPCAGLRVMLGIERREPYEESGHRQNQATQHTATPAIHLAAPKSAPTPARKAANKKSIAGAARKSKAKEKEHAIAS